MGRLKKQEYIDRYGEDAWLIEKVRRTEIAKKDRHKHMDRVNEYNRQYAKTTKRKNTHSQ